MKKCFAFYGLLIAASILGVLGSCKENPAKTPDRSTVRIVQPADGQTEGSPVSVFGIAYDRADLSATSVEITVTDPTGAFRTVRAKVHGPFFYAQIAVSNKGSLRFYATARFGATNYAFSRKTLSEVTDVPATAVATNSVPEHLPQTHPDLSGEDALVLEQKVISTVAEIERAESVQRQAEFEMQFSNFVAEMKQTQVETNTRHKIKVTIERDQTNKVNHREVQRIEKKVEELKIVLQEEKIREHLATAKPKENATVDDDFYVFDTLTTLDQTNAIETPVKSTNKKAHHTKKTNAVKIPKTKTNTVEPIDTNELFIPDVTSATDTVEPVDGDDETQVDDEVETDDETEVDDEVDETPTNRQPTMREIIEKTRGFGYIAIKIIPDTLKYRLYLNGKYITVLDMNTSFSKEFMAGEIYDVMLVNDQSSKTVFRKSDPLLRNQTNLYEYIPRGKLIARIDNLSPYGALKIDGEQRGVITTNAYKAEFDLEAYKNYRVDIVGTNDFLLNRQMFSIRESEDTYLTLDLGYKQRFIYFTLRGLEGGPTVQAGVNFKLGNFFDINLYVGASFSSDPVFKGDLEATWYFLAPKDSFFRLGLTAFAANYVAFSGNLGYNCSPGLGLTVNLDWFYLSIKARYSFVNGKIIPMIGLGFNI